MRRSKKRKSGDFRGGPHSNGSPSGVSKFETLINSCVQMNGGGCLTPSVVSSPASGPVQQALTDPRLQLGKHLILQQRVKGQGSQ
jgi:hypothetical protein